MSIDAYPLCWPGGYPRTEDPAPSRFGRYDYKKSKNTLTLFKARFDLEDEIRRTGGSAMIISTNMPLRKDGGVYAGEREPDDSGVAVYFQLHGAPVVLCCDKWRTVRENTYAIALTVEAMRGMDRWGVSDMLDRMFTGFTALPAPGDDWPAVLGVSPDADVGTIKTAYRKAMRYNHPDTGGDTEQAARINEAYNRAMEVRSC